MMSTINAMSQPLWQIGIVCDVTVGEKTGCIVGVRVAFGQIVVVLFIYMVMYSTGHVTVSVVV